MPRVSRRPGRPVTVVPSRPRIAAALATIGTGALAVAPAGADPGSATSLYASPDGRPPALTVPDATMAKALTCTPDVAGARRTPVLLVPATGVTPEQNYDWNWKPALAKQGIPTCTIELPDHSLGDLQTAGEYVVFAIRRMHRLAGRRISIVGHSQGGMIFRWAFRFWKDTRPMVDDAIGLAASNHGTDVLSLVPTCITTGCPVASHQQRAGSRFLDALNSRQETFEGISYTNIATRNDEVVARVTNGATGPTSPYLASLPVPGFGGPGGRVTNVAVQDICPADQSEHLTVGTTSNTAYALAMDALTHDGPAEPNRARAAACSSVLMPGVDPTTLQANLELLSALPGLTSVVGVNLLGVPLVTKEAPLKAYVGSQFGGGPADEDPAAADPSKAPASTNRRARVSVAPRSFRAGRTVRLRVRVRDAAGTAVRGARVRVLGRTVRTDRRGRVVVRVRAPRAGRPTVRVTGKGLHPTTATLRAR
jgi:hypothetical protein